MYCIECGIQIPEHSKFCPHCGVKQNKIETPDNEENKKESIVNNPALKSIKPDKLGSPSPILKKTIALYLAWFILHLGILLVFSHGIFTNGYETDDFWPLTTKDISEYDIGEFLFYMLFPLAILFIIKFLKKEKKHINQ